MVAQCLELVQRGELRVIIDACVQPHQTAVTATAQTSPIHTRRFTSIFPMRTRPPCYFCAFSETVGSAASNRSARTGKPLTVPVVCGPKVT